jgi:23S rRNA (adenine2503-C2)-methyltransferase
MTKHWKETKIIKSSDENVKKYVFTNDSAVAEAVLYKYPTYVERTVICCSTQSGCPVGCRFCGAGDNFVRSLTTDEIVSQPEQLLHDTEVNVDEIDRLQIMFMSMGEPMLNWKNLKPALYELYKKFPKARLLISTSAPSNRWKAFEDLRQVSKEIPTIGLQFSVHESTNEARKKLIPSPTMTLEEISREGRDWCNVTGRKPFFNYCVHPNNDSQDDVNRLRDLFHPQIWEATLSVICERDEHIAAANERQRKLAQDFSEKMLKTNYNVRVFNPGGQDDVGGGCGQLWHVQDWMKNHPQLTKQTAGYGLEKVHTPKNVLTV